MYFKFSTIKMPLIDSKGFHHETHLGNIWSKGQKWSLLSFRQGLNGIKWKQNNFKLRKLKPVFY